jgi:hypothetical protein
MHPIAMTSSRSPCRRQVHVVVRGPRDQFLSRYIDGSFYWTFSISSLLVYSCILNAYVPAFGMPRNVTQKTYAKHTIAHQFLECWVGNASYSLVMSPNTLDFFVQDEDALFTRAL